MWVHMHLPVFSVEVKGILRCFQCSALQVYFDLCLWGVSMRVGAYGLMLGGLLNCSSPHILRCVSPALTYSAGLAS